MENQEIQNAHSSGWGSQINGWTSSELLFKNEKKKKREPHMYKKHYKVLTLHAINGEKA